MSKLTVILGGFTLPDQVELTRTPTPNAVDVRTLGGDLFTDFIDYYYGWTIAFDQLDITTWNTIISLWRSQYETGMYLTFQVPALGTNTMAKLDIAPEYFQWNGTQVGDGSQQNYPTLTLQEAFAIS